MKIITNQPTNSSLTEKISVIVPIYMVENYIRRCIDSILSQTYENIEVILVDDGSLDNCPLICDEYAKIDARVKVIHKENTGNVSDTRNVGISVATGEYLMFIDSDDWIDVNAFEIMLGISKEYDADIVQCGHRWFKEKEDIILDRGNSGKITEYSNLTALDSLYGDGRITISIMTKLYKRELFDEKKMFLHSLRKAEDLLITPQILYKAKKIVFLDKNFYNITVREVSLTRAKYSLANLDVSKARYHAFKFFESKNLIKWAKYMKGTYIASLYYNYAECWKLRNKDYEYKRSMSELKLEIDKRFMNGEIHSRNSKIFNFSPLIFSIMYHTNRTMKKIYYKSKDIYKYKIRSSKYVQDKCNNAGL